MANLTVNINANAQPATQEVDNLSTSLNSANKSTQNLNNNLEETVNTTNNLDRSLQQQEVRIKTLDGVINLVGGSVELLAGGLVTLGITSEENAEQFQSLALGALTLADGAKRVFDGYKSLSEARKLYTEFTNASTASEVKNTAALSANAAAAGTITAAQNTAAASILGEKTATDANTISKGINTGGIVANTAASKALTPVLFTNAAGTEAIDLAQKQATASATALSVAQKALPWVAIAAAVAALVGIIYNYVSAQNAAADSAEDLTDEQKKQNRALIDAKNQLSNFTVFQQSYSDALDATYTIEENNIRVLKARGASLETIYNAEKQLLELRIKNAQTQIETDQIGLNNLRQATVLIQQQQEALGNSGVVVSIQATLDALEEQQTKLNNSKKALANLQTDLKVLNIEFQQDVADRSETRQNAAEDALQAEFDYLDAVNALLTDAESARVLAEASKYDVLIEQAAQFGYDTTQLEEARVKAIQKVLDDASAERQKKLEEEQAKELATQRAFRQQLSDLAVDSALGTISALSDLNSIFDENNEKASERAFNREKALNLAETVISTYSSAQKAYASQLIPGDPSSVIRAQIAAAVAIAGGLARVAVISKQKYEPNNPNASGAGAAGGSGAATTGGGFAVPPSGGFNPTNISAQNLGFGGIGGRVQTNGEPEAIRAYVMSGDVMSATQASTNINRRRTLTNR